MRIDNRTADELRPTHLHPQFLLHPEGSVLVEAGRTRVICTASVEDRVPPFLRNTGKGWVTAEYGMLPGSSQARIGRESSRGKVGGRTHEIQRLIGRSLRAITDLNRLGERTVWIDCDVIQADGGTRTASITGAYVALVEAIRLWQNRGLLKEDPIKTFLDLCYEEDSKADVDMNFVITGSGKFIEVQGTAESAPFTKKQMENMTELAEQAIKELLKTQKQVLAAISEVAR